MADNAVNESQKNEEEVNTGKAILLKSLKREKLHLEVMMLPLEIKIIPRTSKH